MRDILFRGKREDNNEWIVGNLVVWSDKSTSIDNCGDINGPFYAVDLFTVGQYTGLKDANGKRIFEGDIVYTEDTFFSIAWIDSWYGFAALMAGTMDRFSIEELKLLEIKVIGNIYDNPELIKEYDN